MEINYIRDFLALVSTGNYLDAAEQLFTSSASLSRHIRKLEDELGFKLFIKQGRTILPSAQAKEFLPFAETLVHAQEQCFHALRTSGNGDNHLRVGVLALENTAYGFTDLLSSFSFSHPEINLEIYEGETRELYEMMQSRRLDMIFSFMASDFKERIERILVAQDEMALFVSADHPLRERQKISFSDLDGLTFVLKPKHSWLSDFSFELLEQHSISFETAAFPASTAMLFSMLSNNSFVSLMPRHSGEYLASNYQKQKQIFALELTPRVDMSTFLIIPQDQPKTPLKTCFVNFIRKMVSPRIPPAKG